MNSFIELFNLHRLTSFWYLVIPPDINLSYGHIRTGVYILVLFQITFRVSTSNPSPPGNLPLSLLGQLTGQTFGTSTTFLSTSLTLVKSLTLSKSVQVRKRVMTNTLCENCTSTDYFLSKLKLVHKNSSFQSFSFKRKCYNNLVIREQNLPY